MLKCNILEVQGFSPAIKGMRNPKNSWNKSDSSFWDSKTGFCVGDNDMKLMQNLFKAGTEHRKYLRMIQVWMDITAPLYWWKEFDTYKVGTVANSCSTMHKIHDKEFTLDDFSHDHLYPDGLNELQEHIIVGLNNYRKEFIASNNKDDWYQMIQMLPSSYNQKRTVMLNYEVVMRIIEQRSGHKLDEWHQLVDVLSDLPFIREICSC